MTGRARKILIAIAVVAFLAGVCGALIRGFRGVSQDCREWAGSHGYQLVRDDWWAKSRGCVAKSAAGDDLYHSEGLGSKATGWVWQFAIFAGGAVPAVIIVGSAALRWRRGAPGADP